MARCWSSAEGELRALVLQEHPSPSEVLITELFAGKLRTAVDKASRAGEVEVAFLTDLQRAIPYSSLNLAGLASGLIARVNLPNQWQEGHVSAADLGLLVTRPIVEMAFGGNRVEFRRDHATGLLAQAKLGRPRKRVKGGRIWNRLTKAQERLYPELCGYYSLLLYRLNGLKANELQAFGWQLCTEPDVTQAKKWLRSDFFPGEITSSDLLARLFARTIGTEDPKVIETIIDPDALDVHSINLEIFWPDGAGPPPSVELREREHQRQQIQLYQ